MVAAKLATMKQGARTDIAHTCAKSQTDAAAKLNVSRRTVQAARHVREHGDKKIIAAVESGNGRLKVHRGSTG